MIRFIRSRVIDRRKKEIFQVGPREELPLDVWRYLVKRRARFKCENIKYGGKHTKVVQAHHIFPRDWEEINTLANGKCLCLICHAPEKTYLKEGGKAHQWFCERLGDERGTELLYLLRNIKSARKRDKTVDAAMDEQLEHDIEELREELNNLWANDRAGYFRRIGHSELIKFIRNEGRRQSQ